MKKSLLVGFCLMLIGGGVARAAGLPKPTVQMLMKALQDANVEVRTAAALALAEVPSDARLAVKALEAALVASGESAEQEAMAKALVAVNDGETPKRLTAALSNPQFIWGNGAKPKAVEVIGKVGQKNMIKWLTDLVGSEQEPAVRAAAARALGEIGAPPKKEEK